jgi:membrane protein DedA with SNARE-associated domain
LFVVGGFINGWLWYLVGFFAGAKTIDKWIIRDEKKRKVLNRIRGYFERYSGRALILTRMTLSFTVATLIMAGSLKYSPKKFSFYNLIGATGWVIITMAAGYFFGESYKHVFVYIANITYVAILLAVFIALIYLVRILFKSAFVRSLLLNEKLKEMGEQIKESIDNFLSEPDRKK